MLLQWFRESLEAGSGFVSPWVIVDLLVLYATLVITRQMVFPIIRNYRMGRKISELCGTDEKHWFYGHTRKYGFSESGLLNTIERTKSFPSFFCKWFSPFLTQVEVTHPDTVAPALHHKTPKNELGYRFVRPWIGDGLLTSHGKKWQRNRRLLTPAFHYNVLKPYLKIFNNCAKLLVSNWEMKIGNSVDVTNGVSMMTLDTMLRCAMSFKTNCQKSRGSHPYIEAVEEMSKSLMKRLENPLYLIDWIFYRSSHGKKFLRSVDIVHKEAEKIIKERRKVLTTNGPRDVEDDVKKDFLDILIEAKDEDGKGLTDAEIRDEVDTFLFEGHDTTASGISWMLYNVAKYPEFQEECRNEVLSVMGDRDNVQWDDLTNIPYCTMFIKENLRLYPPVPVIARYLTSPLALTKDVTLPSKCNMAIQILACHRNEHVWENSERFDPERFTLDNISKRSSHAFIPFSAGPRNCIGQNFAMNEIKVVLCQVLRRYRLYLDRDTPAPKMKQSIVLRSENGIAVKFADL